LASTTSPDGRSEFLRRLLEIRQDPQVKSFARRRAGSSDLAEDALQEAFYAIAKQVNAEQITNLRAYFYRVVGRKADELRGQLGAYPADDAADLADLLPGLFVRPALAAPVEETVSRRLIARRWREFFAARRAYLLRHVPGRSPDPVRYRELIVSVAEKVLLSTAFGDVSDADGNGALRSAYPEWFAGEGCAVGNGHQRFSRARADVCQVLRLVVERGDLVP
jgi:hypothetical protein